MRLQLISLLHFIFFLLAPLPSSSRLTHQPDCPTRCGNVPIPYPFGVGSGCSLEASFNIACDNSTSPPKLYLNISNENIEVVEIKVDNPAQIRIKYPYPLLYGACYDISSSKKTWSDRKTIDLSETQYTLSEDNWLTAIGCDDLVAVAMYKGDGNQTFRDGCIGICFDDHNSTGSCPKNGDGNSGGEGCCRSPITKGASYLSASLIDLSKSWNSTRVFSCSYAFIKERGSPNNSGYSYNYSILEERSTAFLDDGQVVRLDWRIGNQSCSQAPRNSRYACGPNSGCDDFVAEVGGYNCKCSKGYAGNPYLNSGCRGC